MPKLMYEDRKKAMEPYGKITREDYLNLNSLAKEIHDYWMKWKPNLYNSMSKEEMLEYLENEGQRLDDLAADLIQSGMDVPGALEVVRSQIYDEMQT